MKHLARLVSLASLFLTVLATSSRAADDRTNWACWLHDDSVRAACMVLDSGKAPPHAGTAAATHVAAMAWGPAALLRAIRNHPGSLHGQVIYVPMHGMPTDDSWAGELVEAVLCGRRPHCSASYRSDARQLTGLSPERFVDLHDPFAQLHRM